MATWEQPASSEPRIVDAVEIALQKQSEAEASATAAAASAVAAAASAAQTEGKVSQGRVIATTGLLQGGGDLSADRTHTVPKASAQDVIDGTRDDAAVTPLAIGDALVKTTRQISVSGLAQGGGDLSADRAISVPVATLQDAVAGLLNNVAMTPFVTKRAVDAALAVLSIVYGSVEGQIPATIRPRGPETRERPIAEISQGGYSVWRIDADGAMISTHTHAEFDVYGSLTQTIQRVPLGPRKYAEQFSRGGYTTLAIDREGKMISNHDHAEFGRFERAVRKADKNETWVVWEETVGSEQHIMVHGGISAHRLTPLGHNWTHPTTFDAGVVHCLSDYTTGVLDPHTVLADGTIFPGSNVLNHRLVTGQSLSLGSRGFMPDWKGDVQFVEDASGAVYSSAPSRFGGLALMFKDVGVRIDPRGLDASVPSPSILTDFEPLREEFDGTVAGETICSGFANAALQWCATEASASRRFLFTVSGRGGLPYALLKKGTSIYESMMVGVSQARAVALSKGWKYRVTSLSILHGESQSSTTAGAYAAMLEEWRSDYEADVRAIEPGNGPVTAYVSQVSTQDSTNVEIPVGQLMAHDSYPHIVLIGPKYQFPYYDRYHMLAEGYFKVGELESLFERHTLAGRKCQPLRIVSAVASGTTVIVTYNNDPGGDTSSAVPIGVLEIDTSLFSDPGAKGYAISGVGITGVALGGDGKSIILTTDFAPSLGANLEYALQTTLDLPNLGGGPRGNIRCGARVISEFDNRPLVEWAVGQRIAIS